jgi:hypothetical protein
MMNNPYVRFYGNKEFCVQIVLNSGKQVFAKPTQSFHDIDNDQHEENTTDVITTLQMYYNPKFIDAYDQEISHDQKIYRSSLSDILDGDYPLYDYLKETYGVYDY